MRAADYRGNRYPVKATDARDHMDVATCSPPGPANIGCPMYNACRLPTKGRHVAAECSEGCDGNPHPVWVLLADGMRNGGEIIWAHCAKWYSELKDDPRYGERIPYSKVTENGIARKVMDIENLGTKAAHLVNKTVYVQPPREAILGDEANDSSDGAGRHRPIGEDLIALSLGSKDRHVRGPDEFGPTAIEENLPVGGSQVVTTHTKGPKERIDTFIKDKNFG